MIQSTCENCSFFTDNSDYNDFGLLEYPDYVCEKHKYAKSGNSGNASEFPYKDSPQDCFIPDFWFSEFASQHDGSAESLRVAQQKWSEKYLEPAAVNGD